MFGAAGFGGFVYREIVCRGACDEVGEMRRWVGFGGLVVTLNES